MLANPRPRPAPEPTMRKSQSTVRATGPDAVRITAPVPAGAAPLLTPEALGFLAELTDRFRPRIDSLLAARTARQVEFDGGELPGFRLDTAAIRAGDWRVAPIPDDLHERRVEITGPVDRKMIINALNSGANVFMADFEDSLAPTWENIVGGQRNLHDAVRRTIDFRSDDGRDYRLNENTAVLMVRPRGWHLPEKHASLAGRPVPGALFDFGLYLFHNARELVARGTGPYFYLPKLESMEEATLWADVFELSEKRLGLAHGTIKATVLIETCPAAFEMDEMLHALRDYIVGLNCGRWDYIFSFIKKFRADPRRVFPDRAQVTMTRHFLHSYSRLLIRTCHRRGAFAMGGMAAQIPIKNDPAASEAALAQVRADKEREAGDGHDGTWVAHPGLVPVARQIFDRLMPGPNQLDRPYGDIEITADDLLAVPDGTITAAGVDNNASVAVQYLAAWFAGNGCVPINHLMEDAATAEIARAQLWQWVHHGAHSEGGAPVSAKRVGTAVANAARRLTAADRLPSDAVERAAELVILLVGDDEFVDFLTLPAYDQLP